jgi:hypothetical protein
MDDTLAPTNTRIHTTMKFEIIQKSAIECRIEYDCDPLNPRTECDNLGTMVCWHNRYTLGDEQPSQDPPEYLETLARRIDPDKMDRINDLLDRCYYQSTREANLQAQKERHIERTLAEHYVILPLYLYDHGGITISTGRFSCPWDSGQVGFIYTPMDTARENWPNWTDEETREAETRCLLAEVETYDLFLTGEVYGYVVERVYYDEDGDVEEREELDSCWGFFGREFAEEEARSMAETQQAA